MFEKRLKILLVMLLVGVGILTLRAFHLQVIQQDHWEEEAKKSLKRANLLDTVRGTILDVKGRPIAQDVACIDACIDYRAIQSPPDEAWVRTKARERRARAIARGEPPLPLADEIKNVKEDIEGMWTLLARLPGENTQSISEKRRSIVQRVEMRRRVVWYASYEKAVKQHESAEKPAWYKRWVAGSNLDAPKLEDYEIEVGEQVSSHPVIKNVSAEINNFLDKNRARLPGLELKPGITRSYPYGPAGAHLMGHLAKVSREDLDADNNPDELRQYLPSDQIGRSGLEALFETELRGSRGRIVRQAGQDDPLEETAAIPGKDVRTTIDIELQRKIQQLFEHARFKFPDDTIEVAPMHGAAVVLDIATNEVRAMASYPAFDPNTLEVEFKDLLEDEINLPLMNRATTAMLEPGSTVKPMVGMSAITQGIIGVDDTIRCDGFLRIGGRQYSMGRCWTQTQFHTSHQHTPWADPHPTGLLTYTDAVQRSCNIYFETMGDRLGVQGLSLWMDRFGLGRPTGVGVTEAKGLIPSQVRIPTYLQKSTSWFAGIGQGKVTATPIQIANVAATIARDGFWMRPKLYPSEMGMPKALKSDGIPEQVNLNLSPAALQAGKLGMVRVVNTAAGSAKDIKRDDIVIAGKTGTAQAAPFTYRKRDENGNLMRDEKGRVVREQLRMSTQGNPNPIARWYRGTGKTGDQLAHAWFMGFAPADNPQIAFCVLVEYGGGGGRSAAPIAKDIIQACIDAGYLDGKHSPSSPTPPRKDQVTSGGVGLLTP